MTSSVAVLAVLVAPTITVQPQSQTNLAGTSVVFSVALGVSTPVNYQWQFDGTNIDGATGSTLVLTNVQFSQEGSYSVVVSNPAGSTNSTPATLTVLSPPLFVTPPQSQVGFWGEGVTFSVNVAGTPPFSYQWQYNGAPIAGATGASLVLTNLQMTNGGSYTVVVTNLYGAVMSDPAYLTMNPAGVSLALYAGVTINGVVGLTYGIQYTTNLSNTNSWQGLANVTLGEPSELWFDVRPTGRQGYYRVVPGPISIP